MTASHLPGSSLSSTQHLTDQKQLAEEHRILGKTKLEDRPARSTFCSPHLVIGQVQVIEVGQVLKRLLGEPFKGQARALDEEDATGEHKSHPTPTPGHLPEEQAGPA